MNYSRRFRRGVALAVILLVPFMVSAQAPVPSTFTNPLGTNTTVITLLSGITNFILGLAGFLALLSLVWGGTMYIISFGDDAGIKRAKAIVVWSIFGLVVIILAFFVVRTVTTILGVTGI